MVELSIRKRYRKNGTIMYEYRFEIATVNGGRKWKTKCGFKTKAEAQRAGKAALQQYENFGQVIEKDEISYSDYLDYWIENDCKVDLKPNTAKRYQKRVNFILKPRFPIHFICVRENGTYITPRTMQHVSKVIKRDIFPAFDFHSLRVSHASMLAGLGVEPKYIQTRLGHTDLELTINVYERVTDMMAERGRKAINELYSE